MKAAVKAVLGGIGAVLLLVAVLGAVALTTEPGARLVIGAALARLPFPAEAGEVSGTLAGRVVLRDVILRPAFGTVRIERIAAQWKPFALLSGTLAFDTVLADTVAVDVAGDGTDGTVDSAAARHPPRLPLDVAADRLTARQISIAAPGFRLQDGELHLSGRAQAYDFAAGALFSTGPISPTPVEVSGTGSLERVHLAAMAARPIGGRITGEGRLAWYPRLAWTLAFEGAGLDPARLLADSTDWPGDLSLRATTSGVLTDTGAVARLTVDTISGSLRGEPVSGRARIRREPEGYMIPLLALSWGAADLRASGELADELDFTWTLDVPTIGNLLPHSRGSLHSKGTVRGSVDAPVVSAEIEGTDLVHRDRRLARLTGDVELDLRQRGSSQVDLLLRGLRTGGIRIERATVTGSGVRGRHRLRVVASGGEWSGRLVLAGGFAPDRWRWTGTFDSLRAEHPAVGRWSLHDTGRLALASDSAAITETCLESGAALVCAAGRWRRAAGWRLAGLARELPVARANRFLPAEWSLAGTTDAELRAAIGPHGAITGELRLEPDSLIVVGAELPYRHVALDSTLLRIQVGSDGTRADAHGVLATPAHERLGRFAGTAVLPGFHRIGQPLQSQQIEARLDAYAGDLAVFGALVPQVDALRGVMTAEIAVTGTVGDPRLAGNARVRNAAAHVPAAGITIRDVTLMAVAEPDGNVRVEGNLRSGHGWLRFDGRAGLTRGVRPLRLHLEGNQFEAVSLDRVRAVVSPSLTLVLERDSVLVDGSIGLPVLQVTSSQRSAAADTIVQPSDDVVLTDSLAPPRPSPPAIHGQIRLVLGDSVRIAGRRLSTQLDGSVLLTASGDDPIEATGDLFVRDGHLLLRSGRTLAIEGGHIRLGGSPVADPGLFIQATPTDASGVLTGIRGHGEIRIPTIALLAGPPPVELDLLAYLVLGQRLAAAGDVDEANMMADFSASLGPGGARSATSLARSGDRWIGERDRSHPDLVEPSFASGEYVAPHFSVGYSAAVFAAESVTQLRYFMSRSLLLSGERGRESGTDVFYHVEPGAAPGADGPHDN